MNPPIDILDYRVLEISVKTNPDFNSDLPSTLEYDISMGINELAEQSTAILQMLIKSKSTSSSNRPYDINLTIEGAFSYQPDMEKEDLKKFLNLNAPSILYGIARGMVSQTTAPMTNGKILLSTVNFYSAVENKTSQEKSK